MVSPRTFRWSADLSPNDRVSIVAHLQSLEAGYSYAKKDGSTESFNDYVDRIHPEAALCFKCTRLPVGTELDT